MPTTSINWQMFPNSHGAVSSMVHAASIARRSRAALIVALSSARLRAWIVSSQSNEAAPVAAYCRGSRLLAAPNIFKV